MCRPRILQRAHRCLLADHVRLTRLGLIKFVMVLPGRIELPTSALPRMRSTTELRQHAMTLLEGRPALHSSGGALA